MDQLIITGTKFPVKKSSGILRLLGKNVSVVDYVLLSAAVESIALTKKPTKPWYQWSAYTTCATICTQAAVEFSPTEYIQRVIQNEKILTKTKDILRNHPEKYSTG